MTSSESTSFQSNSSSGSAHAKKAVPQQIENLSPLAVGDQKLNRHLGFFSGTMMNGKSTLSILETFVHSLYTILDSRPNYRHWHIF